MIKKIISIVGGVFMVGVLLLFPQGKEMVYATENNEIKLTEENLEEIVFQQIDNIDYSELENFLESEENLNFFKNQSISEILKNIITTGKGLSLAEIFNLALGSISVEITTVLKLVALIVAIVGFGAFSETLQNFSKKSGSLSSVVSFVILAIILYLVAGIITDFVGEVNNLLLKIKSVMEIVFPLLLSLLITVGGSTSSATFQPAVVVLTGSIIEIIIYATTTAITLYLVLSVVGELNENIKLDKLKNFISSSFKWVVGLIFTIFMGYLSLSGITAGGTDKISIKTAKYAIKSYIPLVGGYVSDSYEIFRIGSVLIKNSIGVVGVIILFALVIGKVVALILYNLGFKLASGLSEPLGVNKITKFLSSLSTIFNFLIAGIMACFLLCFFTLVIIMSSANIF